MIRNALILLLIFVSSIAFGQQEPLTRLFSQQKSWYNPAYASFEDGNALMITHRQQWLETRSRPHATLVTFNHYFDGLNSGVGVVASYDKVGNRKVKTGGLSYSYRINVNEDLKIGLGGQLQIINMEYEGRFIAVQLNDPVLNDTKGSTVTVNGGMYIKYKEFNTGISIKHLNEPSVDNLFEYQRHYFWMTQYDWEMSEKLSLSPSVLFKSSNRVSQFDLNLTSLIGNKVYLGFGYLDSDFHQYNITLGAKFKESLSFMMGYVPDNSNLGFGESVEFALTSNF